MEYSELDFIECKVSESHSRGLILSWEHLLKMERLSLGIQRNLEEEIDKMERLTKLGTLTENELRRLQALQSEVMKWRNTKAKLMRQYSRCNTLNKKDNNTKYFQLLAFVNRRWKLKTRLMIDGQLVKDKEKIIT